MVKTLAIDAVEAAYGEPWRAYHASRHILGMLREANRLLLDPDDRLRLSVLIIYHDVWYKIGRAPGENEQMSAAQAVTDLRHYQREDREYLHSLVRQGIEATATHTLDGVEPQFIEIVSLLLDLDLWGLGQSAERFRKDTEAIWHEYEPRYLRAEFDQGRSAWAASFLKRPRIYHTARYEHLEEQARVNLAALANQ